MDQYFRQGFWEQVSGASKRVKRQVSGPVLLSGFLVDLAHSAKTIDEGKPKSFRKTRLRLRLHFTRKLLNGDENG